MKNSQTDLYRHYDAQNNLIYIGVSLSALNRLGQHQQNSHWFSQIKKVEIETFSSRSEALIAEERAIKTENPLYNKTHNKNVTNGPSKNRKAKKNAAVSCAQTLNDLTLNEQHVIQACIAQVDSAAALLETECFELFAKDFAGIFSISETNAYAALIDVAESLFKRCKAIDNPYASRSKEKWITVPWISSIEYWPDDGKIALCFSEKILPYLIELRTTGDASHLQL